MHLLDDCKLVTQQAHHFSSILTKKQTLSFISFFTMAHYHLIIMFNVLCHHSHVIRHFVQSLLSLSFVCQSLDKYWWSDIKTQQQLFKTNNDNKVLRWVLHSCKMAVSNINISNGKRERKKWPAYQARSKPHNGSWSAIWELRPSRTNLRLVAPLGIKIPCNTGTAACLCCGCKVLNWVNNPSLR